MQDREQAQKHLIDPDPVTVAVTVLGAVGSVTSILSYMDQVKDRRSKEEFVRTEILGELFQLTTGIEAALAEIETALRKMELYPSVAQMTGGLVINRADNGEVPFELGAITLNLPEQQFRDFANTHKRIARACSSVIRDVYAAVHLLYKARVDITEDLYNQLVQLRLNTNKLLRGEMAYPQAFKTFIEVTGQAKEITESLKSEFVIGPGPGNRPTGRGPRFG